MAIVSIATGLHRSYHDTLKKAIREDFCSIIHCLLDPHQPGGAALWIGNVAARRPGGAASTKLGHNLGKRSPVSIRRAYDTTRWGLGPKVACSVKLSSLYVRERRQVLAVTAFLPCFRKFVADSSCFYPAFAIFRCGYKETKARRQGAFRAFAFFIV
jgi:hypothetical protein